MYRGMGSSTKRRLTLSQFEAAKNYVHISGERIEAARLAMVHGKKIKDIAKIYGQTSQAISIDIRKMWEAYQQSKALQSEPSEILPAGFEKAVIIAPTEIMNRIRQELAAYNQNKEVTKKK